MALARVLCPTLIGRESELSTLEDALLSALRGDGGVVIVGGEAGMGKTRLVNELTTPAFRLRCAVMAGACSEAELSLPYLPFLEAIGNRLATDGFSISRIATRPLCKAATKSKRSMSCTTGAGTRFTMDAGCWPKSGTPD